MTELVILTIASLIGIILLIRKGRNEAKKDTRTTQYYENEVDEHSPENLDLNVKRFQPLSNFRER